MINVNYNLTIFTFIPPPVRFAWAAPLPCEALVVRFILHYHPFLVNLLVPSLLGQRLALEFSFG